MLLPMEPTVDAAAVVLWLACWVLWVRLPMVMPRPPPLKRPDSVFCVKLVWRLVLVAASMLTLLPALRVASLSAMTVEPLMLMSLLAVTLTLLPPTVVPTAWVVLPVSRRVVVLKLSNPLLVLWLPQAMSDVFCPASKLTLLPAVNWVAPWLLCSVAAVAFKLLPALTVRLPLLLIQLPTS